MTMSHWNMLVPFADWERGTGCASIWQRVHACGVENSCLILYGNCETPLGRGSHFSGFGPNRGQQMLAGLRRPGGEEVAPQLWKA